jgi:uncharacterized protein YndB with AHSA1/START domain
MTDLTINHDIVIEAPIDIVWRTITEPEQISQWFADRTELELRPGGAGRFTFDDHATNRPFVAPLVVEAVEPPTRFSFRWAHPDGEQPTPSTSILTTFTLAAQGEERTHLRVVETGLDAIGWPEADKVDYAEDHRQGWARHTGRMAAMFTGAAGTPA